MKIIVTSDRISGKGIDIKNWIAENNKYIIDTYQDSNSSSYTIYTLEFKSFADNSNSLAWATKNSDFIDFEASSGFIEKEHLIDISSQDIDVVKGALSKLDKIDISLQKLKLFIGNNAAFDLNTVSYNEFLSFEIIDKKLQISTVKSYTESCYSFPLFYSIIKNNKVTDESNCIFSFVKVNINGNTIAFSVDFGTRQETKFYDYSYNPPRGTFWSIIAGIEKNNKL